MASAEEIAIANEDGDFKAKMTRMFNEWELAKSNLLEIALMLPGSLRFGGNIMQLGNYGAQIASAGSQVEALWFTNKLVPNPNDLAVSSSITGTDDGTIATMRFKSQSAGGNIQAYNQATATVLYHIVEVFATGQSLTTQLEVRTWDADLGALLLTRLVLGLAQLTADPTTLQDGMLWYRTDTDVIRARINGATVNLATGTVGTTITNQTGTYSAVVGDFVRCSGTFTVTLPSAPANNSEVWVKNAGTGTITVARGGSDTMFVFTSGLTTVTLAPGEALGFKYYATGTEWSVF